MWDQAECRAPLKAGVLHGKRARRGLPPHPAGVRCAGGNGAKMPKDSARQDTGDGSDSLVNLVPSFVGQRTGQAARRRGLAKSAAQQSGGPTIPVGPAKSTNLAKSGQVRPSPARYYKNGQEPAKFGEAASFRRHPRDTGKGLH
eukprot:gene23180-biopygen2819